jgi:protein-tyrosine-phosphatase
MMRVLVVCTGNQSRSPLAAAILKARLDVAGLDRWLISSAGTWADSDRPAIDLARQAAEGMGLSLEGHRSRRVSEDILRGQDLVLVMERGHAEALRAEFPWVAERIYLLSSLAGEPYDIRDPYSGSLEAYRQLAEELDRLVERALPKILELAQANPHEGTMS